MYTIVYTWMSFGSEHDFRFPVKESFWRSSHLCPPTPA